MKNENHGTIIIFKFWPLMLNIYNEGKSIFQEILCEQFHEQFKQVSALMMNNILMTRTITFKYECTVIYVS